jgi:hypothetical protein
MLVVGGKMTTKLARITAKIINKRFSKSALVVAAQELGVHMPDGGDIFQAMIDAGKAADFDAAVNLVTEHLDKDPEDNHDEGAPRRRINDQQS